MSKKEPTTYFLNVIKLCGERGESLKDLPKKLKFPPNAIKVWREGKIPTDSYLKRVAKYFAISVEDLLRPPSKPITHSDILKLYHDSSKVVAGTVFEVEKKFREAGVQAEMVRVSKLLLNLNDAILSNVKRINESSQMKSFLKGMENLSTLSKNTSALRLNKTVKIRGIDNLVKQITEKNNRV